MSTGKPNTTLLLFFCIFDQINPTWVNRDFKTLKKTLPTPKF